MDALFLGIFIRIKKYGVSTEPWVGLNIAEHGSCEKARADYHNSRSNGENVDNPTWPFPCDGTYSYKASTCWSFNYEYYEGRNDRAWMEKKDRNYIFRLENEGRLGIDEPNLQKEVPQLYKKILSNRAGLIEANPKIDCLPSPTTPECKSFLFKSNSNKNAQLTAKKTRKFRPKIGEHRNV